ncbi:MAG: protein-export chaperone SecB [Betaproteobacteria bacterium]|nr:protein-export chaperone SecB [Betaproteobacteria bacterium]
MSESPQPMFAIEKIYLKDLSVEVPNAPDVFLEREAPTVDVNMNSNGRALQDGLFEVVLTITITAKLKDKTIFLVEAAQAGLFRIRNVPPQDMGPLLGIACPNTLFPYVRETISAVTSRAGFSPVVLAPMTFEGIYQQQMQQLQQQQQQQQQQDPKPH